jgi:hypothetical protein
MGINQKKGNDAAQKLLNKSLLNTNPYFISDTTIRTGLDGYAIQAIEDTVIAAITYAAPSGANTLVGETILAGHVWYLPSISSIDLTSGALFVHQH